MFSLGMIENILLFFVQNGPLQEHLLKNIDKKSSFYWKMPCHHDFIKMSHHRANTKYGENTSLIHQEI